ncbi:phosphoribosylglycinamide formyltransferase [Nafulsella turpanensis]|uniref:phosphoribosylglycinamide formyltransferase n=1 Tax=Nafulsella turpanensis TaxID=1265690 RepID=UPI0003452E6C|nr:phosphoribosylglycinamide formyltransferase [Nafulsella turpanensis]
MKNSPIKIAIFASGSGTNAERFFEYFKDSSLAEVALLACNNKEAYVLERAKRHQVPVQLFSNQEIKAGEPVVQKLKEARIDFIVLAGFLRLIPAELVAEYPQRIVNIHPALLPKWGGKGMYGMRVHEAVRAAGEKEAGISIHYVNEAYDEGDIIFQASCPVEPEDGPAEIAQKVHRLEYAHYPRVVEKLLRQLADKDEI